MITTFCILHLIFYWYLAHSQSDSSSSESESSDDSNDATDSTSLFNFDQCNCFSVKLSSIHRYHVMDPSTHCYVYDIQKDLSSLRCSFSIDDIILSVCNNNDKDHLDYIYSSIIDYFPRIDDNGDEIIISPFSNSDIMGLLISMSVTQSIQFTLCLKEISTLQVGNQVRFHRMFDTEICDNNDDGLPCIS